MQPVHQKGIREQAVFPECKAQKGDGRLTYASSNPKVVKVENGKATIKGTGRAVITVTAGETEKYRKKTVKVTVDVTPKKQKAIVKVAGKGN